MLMDCCSWRHWVNCKWTFTIGKKPNIHVPPCEINETERYVWTNHSNKEKGRTRLIVMYPRRVKCVLSFYSMMSIVFRSAIRIRTGAIMDLWNLNVIVIKSLPKCRIACMQRTKVIIQRKLIRDNPKEVGIDCLVSAFCGTALEENKTDERRLLTAGLTLHFHQPGEQGQ